MFTYSMFYCGYFRSTEKHLVNELSSEIYDSLKYLQTSPSTAAQYVDYKRFLENSTKRVCC